MADLILTLPQRTGDNVRYCYKIPEFRSSYILGKILNPLGLHIATLTRVAKSSRRIDPGSSSLMREAESMLRLAEEDKIDV